MASFGHVTLFLALIGLVSVGARVQMPFGSMMMPMGMGMGGLGMGGMGGMGLNPMFGGGFGFGDLDFDDDDSAESLRLTCSNNVTGHNGQTTDAMSVTISYGTSGNGYNFGGDPFGYYGYGSSIGSTGTNAPLKAEVQILSSGIGRASVVFTQRARVEDGCTRENLGPIYSSTNNNQGQMYSGYGHMGLGMGMGMGMGMGLGSDLGGNGVLKEDIKLNVNLQTIYIDSIDGFSSLSDLAGRGVAVCSDSNYGWDWEATCEGPIYMCCALKYDNKDQRININNYSGAHTTYA